MRRLLAVAVLLALVVAGAALAGRGDPQKKINAADQARAKAMLLRTGDLQGFKATPPGADEDDFYCRALDESDLTLTGDAESPDFEARDPFAQGGVVAVSSYGQVYESLADANASWRRGTSASGLTCAREVLRREVSKAGSRFVLFKRIAYPRLTQRTVAFRMVAVTQGVRFYFDIVVLMQSRGHATIAVARLPVGSRSAVVDSLARVVAARMKTAMRGA